MIRTKKVCIVDAYSTGVQLAPLFNQHGWKCIHVQSAPDISEEFLASFEAMFHTPGPGEKLSRTTDLFTNPGIVYLCHHDQRQIETDYRQIRAYEKAGRLFSLYERAQ